MHILLADETNRRPSADCKFFVYGGLLLPVEKLPELHTGVEAIRQETGYKPGDILKFDTRERPTHIPIEKATEAKQKTVSLCITLGCKFIAHVILHDIIKNQDPDQHILWAADSVFGRFHKYLDTVVHDDGIIVVDNLPVKAQFQYLSEKFAYGLHLHDGTDKSLSRIKLFAASCVGASHANSAMDIVLGSFRYCINNPKNRDAAREMIGAVTKLIWHDKTESTLLVIDRGLIPRPRIKDIKVEKYKQEYTDLFVQINTLIKGT